jgi:hypothetical protein
MPVWLGHLRELSATDAVQSPRRNAHPFGSPLRSGFLGSSLSQPTWPVDSSSPEPSELPDKPVRLVLIGCDIDWQEGSKVAFVCGFFGPNYTRTSRLFAADGLARRTSFVHTASEICKSLFCNDLKSPKTYQPLGYNLANASADNVLTDAVTFSDWLVFPPVAHQRFGL